MDVSPYFCFLTLTFHKVV